MLTTIFVKTSKVTDYMVGKKSFEFSFDDIKF
jgi:hypothetical protein